MAEGKKLLLISSQPEDKIFVTQIGAAISREVKVVTTAEEAAADIVEGSLGGIFVDATTEKQYRDFEKMVQEKIGLFSDKVNPNTLHFLSVGDLETVPFLIQSPFFGNYVKRNFGDVTEAAKHYARVIRASQATRPFGLTGLLQPGAKTQVVKLKQSSQKQDAVEAVRNFLLSSKFHTRMAAIIANAVDELLMNAVFDAPVDTAGKPVYLNTPRSTVFELQGKSEVEMHVGVEQEYVAIMAADNYGSLDKVKLMTHISKLYNREEYKVKTSVAGAGLGLATVFHSGGSFFFASEAGERTEVTVFFRRTNNFREFKDQFRFISTQFIFGA